MALLLPNSLFLHLPKTGGMWVREAIKRAGISSTEVGDRHANCPRISVHDCFTFVFVRHPLAWYQSQWSYRMQVGWRTGSFQKGTWLDRACASDTFEVFVRNCITRFPSGVVSTIFDKYVHKDAEHLVDFIGHQETLADDLVRALEMAGEDFNERRLRSTPMQNVHAQSKKWKDLCTYTPELRESVLQVEQHAIRFFGYLDEEYEAALASVSALAN